MLSFVQSHARLTVLFFVCLIAFCIWGLKFTKLELDIYDVYDENFQSSVDLFEIKRDFEDQAQVLVVFNFQQTPKAKDLCHILRWSRELNRQSPVSNVTSLWSARAPKMVDGKLWYPKKLDEPCQLAPETDIYLKEEFEHTFFQHLLSIRDGRDLVFDVSLKDSGANLKEIQNLMDQTDRFVSSDLKGVDVRYLGLASSRYYFRKIMQRDSVFSMLVLLIILIFMRLFFGTWKSGGYLIFTLVATGIVLYGMMALLGVSIDILTNNLFLMTAVAGTADFIFLSQAQMKDSYQKSFSDFIRPSFFTSLTTVVGFLSLNASELSMIQRFGNGAAIGGFVEWLMLFLFLPALLKLVGKERVWVNPDKALGGKWIKRIEAFTLPKWGLRLLILLMFGAIPSFFILNDQDSPVLNLPKDHVMRVAYEDFQDKFQWQGQVHLYFPHVINQEEQNEILGQVKQLPLVYRIEDPNELAQEWGKGFGSLKKDLIKRELSMTPLWEKYYSRYGSLRIPLYLKEQDIDSLRDLRNQVEPICGNRCRLAGQRVVYLEYGEKISKTMIESFAVSIVLVLGVLGVLLWQNGKLRFFWPVTISALMGPLVTLSLIGLFQIPVTLITSIFLAVMVGLAGDNAIQYLLANDENLQQGIAHRARASILVTLAMILASSIFTLQTLKPMNILGFLFILGFSINLMGDLFGLKGLLKNKVD